MLVLAGGQTGAKGGHAIGKHQTIGVCTAHVESRKASAGRETPEEHLNRLQADCLEQCMQFGSDVAEQGDRTFCLITSRSCKHLLWLRRCTGMPSVPMHSSLEDPCCRGPGFKGLEPARLARGAWCEGHAKCGRAQQSRTRPNLSEKRHF